MGVIPTKEITKLPISHPLNIPNFNEDGPSRGLLMDELLEHLSFRVANIVNYNENENTLLEHINQGSPELFTVFCSTTFGYFSFLQSFSKIFSEPPFSVSQT